MFLHLKHKIIRQVLIVKNQLKDVILFKQKFQDNKIKLIN